ncbi:hypothetical protein TKK_0000163 [Trichogramma kaykai]|uniref:CCHC-type domain-containing protein n=1 Tax=Trichogramma kaykai TaxID=54128 RepID=A0ABD2W1G4_9HYME
MPTHMHNLTQANANGGSEPTSHLYINREVIKLVDRNNFQQYQYFAAARGTSSGIGYMPMVIGIATNNNVAPCDVNRPRGQDIVESEHSQVRKNQQTRDLPAPPRRSHQQVDFDAIEQASSEAELSGEDQWQTPGLLEERPRMTPASTSRQVAFGIDGSYRADVGAPVTDQRRGTKRKTNVEQTDYDSYFTPSAYASRPPPRWMEPSSRYMTDDRLHYGNSMHEQAAASQRHRGREDKGENAEEFIDQVNDYIAASGLSLDDALGAIPYLLTKRALIWYRTIKDRLDTREDFVEKFKNQYIGEYDREDLMEDLRNRTQGKGEKIVTFLTSHRYIVSRFTRPPSQKQQLEMAWRNLLPEYRRALLNPYIPTLDDLERHGRQWERQRDLDLRYTPPPPAERMRVQGDAFRGPTPRARVAAVEVDNDEDDESALEQAVQGTSSRPTRAPESTSDGNSHPAGQRSELHFNAAAHRPASPYPGDVSMPKEFVGACFIFQRVGHRASECPEVKCYNCDEQGHLSRDCPKPRAPTPTVSCQNCNAPNTPDLPNDILASSTSGFQTECLVTQELGQHGQQIYMTSYGDLVCAEISNPRTDPIDYLRRERGEVDEMGHRIWPVASVMHDIELIDLPSLEHDNRMYVTVKIRNDTYHALLDPGATASVIGTTLSKRYRDYLVSCRSRSIEVDFQHRRRHSYHQLQSRSRHRSRDYPWYGFCWRFDVDVRLGRRLWRVNEGPWRESVEINTTPTPALYAECAALKVVDDDKIERIHTVVNRILAERTTPPGETTIIKHHIKLIDDVPIKLKLRGMSPRMWAVAKQIVEKWFEEGIIEKSASDY